MPFAADVAASALFQATDHNVRIQRVGGAVEMFSRRETHEIGFEYYAGARWNVPVAAFQSLWLMVNFKSFSSGLER